MSNHPKSSDHRICKFFFVMYQLSPPLHHLHQINPTSYFLHIPEIVSTIQSNSFKDKISTILHFLAHIVTQNRVKFTTIPCSFSYVNYYVMRSRNRGVSKIEKSFIFFCCQQNFFTMDKSRPARRLSRTFLLFNVSTFIFIINLSSYNIY